MAEKTIDTLRLLVVSKEPSVLRPLWTMGESNSWHLETAGSGWDALERVQSGIVPHLLLLDLPRGDGDSLHVLRWLRRLRADLPIIVLAYSEDAGRKREALRLGAQDFLVRPFDEKQLELSIRRHLEPSNVSLEAQISSDDIEPLSDGAFFVGASPIMQKLRAQAELLAEADIPVLILGEAGSGKDTAARLIHKLSVRSGCKFLKVNCAALPEDLLESELFGSDRSSATAVRPKIGKLEACDKGTILLDEISEMPNRLQAVLLQVLQEKQFIRPGGETSVDVDVRILAATSTNIERALSERKLREDLYYRLSAFTLHVPPLRQRREEIPLLLQHLMHYLAKHYGMTPRVFSPAVLDACQSYAWPGNLKELESFAKRYLVMGEKEVSLGAEEPDAEDIAGENRSRPQKDNRNSVPGNGHESASGTSSLKSLVQSVKLEAERSAIAAALEKTGWNRKAAARLLKVSYRTLLYKIEQYHMRSPEAYSSPYLGNGYRSNRNGFKSDGKVS
ncbi:MAG: sigma-54 dependent transcriptional regulator [Terriglobales bacterium]